MALKKSEALRPLEGKHANNMGVNDRIPSDPDIQECMRQLIRLQRIYNF
jgi:hypothetical protein